MLIRRLTSTLLHSRTSLVAKPLRPNPITTNTTTVHLIHRNPISRAFSMTSADSSAITPEVLTSKLQSSMNTTHVSIEDISGGCGQSFNAVIVSPEFEKKPLLARHRLVNAALKDEIAAIHAWTPRCLTPDQWAKEKEKMAAQ